MLDHKAADAAAVLPPGVRTHGGKGADGVVEVETGQNPPGLFPDEGKPRRAHGKIRLVLSLRRAQQEAPLHRGDGIEALCSYCMMRVGLFSAALSRIR